VISVKTQVYVWPQVGWRVRSRVLWQVWEHIDEVGWQVWEHIDEGIQRD